MNLLGYDDNIFGGPAHRGAWEIGDASFGADGHWMGRAAHWACMSRPTTCVTWAQPSQNRTDGAAFLGGTIQPSGATELTLGGLWLSRHEDRTALDALPSDRPVAFTVVNLRASYAAEFGRFTVTPAFEIDVGGSITPRSSACRSARPRATVPRPDRVSRSRYGWMPGRDVLWVNRVVATHYDHSLDRRGRRTIPTRGKA